MEHVNEFKSWDLIVQSLVGQSVKWSEQCCCFEHLFAYARAHIVGNQPALRSAEQKHRCFWLVNLKLFNRLKDQQPLVIINLFRVFYDASLAARLAETTLINRKDLEVSMLDQQVWNDSIMLYETTITVNEENDPSSFASFKYRVSESYELDSFSKLDYRQAENILFWEFGVQIDSAVLELPLEQ